MCPQFTQLFSGFTKSLHFNCLEEGAPDTPQTQASSKTQLHVIFFSYEETHVSWTCKHLILEKVLNPELAINSRSIYHHCLQCIRYDHDQANCAYIQTFISCSLSHPISIGFAHLFPFHPCRTLPKTQIALLLWIFATHHKVVLKIYSLSTKYEAASYESS